MSNLILSNLQAYEQQAHELDRLDPLKGYRDLFCIPIDEHQQPKTYLCHNSLGLPTKKAFSLMNSELQRWAHLGVESWFQGKESWYSSFDEPLKKALAHLLGASQEEVVVMNSLTMNLHLLMVSFYQPTSERYKILIDDPTFPSDLYAIQSHLRYHGYDPEEALIAVKPRIGEHCLHEEDIETILEQHGQEIALVFLNPVNFLTGQVLDIQKLSQIAKRQGCIVGCDLAHAAGNIQLSLHKWDVDFAIGCSYKYLSGGPGSPGIAFVHARHHYREMPRFAGWWGNDPKTRFNMHLQPEFVAHGGAASWQVSTPSILALIPLLASLEIYHQAGMPNLREKSKKQTAYLQQLLSEIPGHHLELITPRGAEQRGSQLSLLIPNQAQHCLEKLEAKGIICDFRPPNIIRVTPSPLYNTFHELFHFACVFAEVLRQLDLDKD